MKTNITRSITYGAVAISLSICLNLVPFFQMPLEGSMTLLSMLPLAVYSYMFGVTKGFFVGLAYGILSYLSKLGVFVALNPWQLLLDYPVPCSMIGLSGIFRDSKSVKNKMLLGVLVAFPARFLPHFFSGILFFAEFAGDLNPVLYSFLYNIIWCGADMLLVMAAVFVLERNKAFMSYADGVKLSLQNVKKTEQNVVQ